MFKLLLKVEPAVNWPTSAFGRAFYSSFPNRNSLENSFFSPQDDELYKSKGHDNIQAVIEILKCDGWKLEKTISATGDKIQTIQREFGKVYRMTVGQRWTVRVHVV